MKNALKHISCFLLLLVLSALPILAQRGVNKNFDFSGIDRFRVVMSLLVKDKQPTEKQWTALLNTPGYKALTASEFKPEFFKNYFSMAFMPSRKADLQKELQKSGYRIAYLKHYVNLKENMDQLDQQEKYLKTADLMGRALKLTAAYLPKGVTGKGPLPPVSFVIFGNDARGYSPIVVDLLFSKGSEAFLLHLLAHEAHHFFRNQDLQFNIPPKTSPDNFLVYALNQLQGEGIADQIDKPALFLEGGPAADSEWGKTYQKLLKDTPRVFGAMDFILLQIAELDAAGKDYGHLAQKFLKVIPMSGHTVGFYMTKAIREKLGEDKLIESVGNPFTFFRLYQQVATMKKSTHPMLSQKSFQLILKLEKKYAKK